VSDHLISLASGIVPEFGPAETVAAATVGRWDAVGLWVEPADWTAATTREVRSRLSDSGLSVLDVEVVWIKPGPLDPVYKRIIDIGAEVGASNVLVVCSDPDAGAATAKFAALCAHGRAAGLRVALEFGYFTDVHSIADALAIIAGADDPAAALLIDPLHLARTGGTPEDVARVPRHLLPYAQFCDAPTAGPGKDDVDAIIREAVDERLQCGEGALPLVSLLRALPEKVPLSIELRSRYLRDTYPDPGDRARITAQATRRFLDAHTAR
jgi:sugar phosphate isomerase/epimerase